jgi:predicted TIM-barrel fold metal-dependent hydrolase
MVVNGYGWHERKRPPTSDELLNANKDWYRYTIEQFGPARCMFESNFPVRVGVGSVGAWRCPAADVTSPARCGRAPSPE